MRSVKSFGARASARSVLILAAFIFMAAPPASADPAVCGNVNGTGMVDLGDLSFLITGLTNCAALPNPADADVDGYQGISYRDLSFLAYKISTDISYPLNCAAMPPEYPTSSGTCLNVLNGVAPPNVISMTCTLFVRYTDTLWGFTLPVEFFVDGVPALVTAARGLSGGPDTLAAEQLRKDGSVLLAFDELNLNLLPGTWLFAEVDLTLPSSSSSTRALTIAYGQPGFCASPYDYASPWVFKKGNFDVITPTIGCSCCSGVRGNINMRGITDLADLSVLINYLVGTHTGLVCVDAANINGESIVDLTDLSLLISFLTGGGGQLAACP